MVDLEMLDGVRMAMVDWRDSGQLITWKGGCTFHLLNSSLEEIDARTVENEPESFADAQRCAENWFDDMWYDEENSDYDDSMDGDHDSAMASAGWGTDEDYGG
jgi:hypothetical protein